MWQRIADLSQINWFRAIVCAIALLFALSHASHTAPAQAQRNNSAVEQAELNLTYALDGTSNIDFRHHFSTFQLQPETLASAVEALGNRCQAQWGSPYSDEFGFSHFVNCDRSTQTSGFAQSIELQLQPLIQILQSSDIEISGIKTLSVTIAIPPHLPFHDFPTPFQKTEDVAWPGNGTERFAAILDLTQPEIEPFSTVLFSYGYQFPDIQKMALPLVAIALLAPLLTAIGRRWALQHFQPDNKIAGFHFQQFLSLSGLAIWGGWSASLLGMQWGTLFELMTSQWSVWGQSIGAFAGMTVFPTAIGLLCIWIAYPVTAQLSRAKTSRKQILAEALISDALIAETFALYIAVPALVSGEIRLAIVWFVGAAASAFALKMIQSNLTNFTPQSITVGPLRDRVFELALLAEVDIEQLYILPTHKTQVANAFAVSGGTVMLTDYLLEHLTKREVDAVLAHELSHFERKHHESQQFLLTVLGVLIFVGVLWNPVGHFGLYFAIVLLVLVGGMVADLHQSRRHEYEADWGAAKLTGDPEAMISALAAITELAEMPAMWNPLAEALGTHPSLQNRANAIASAYNIPADRVEQLLLTPDRHRDRYSIPDEQSREQTIYSSDFKSQQVLKVFGLLAGIPALVSATVALLSLRFLPSLPYLPMALCPVAAFISLLYVDNYVSAMGMKDLGVQLQQKFKDQGIDDGAQSGVLIGFSPSLQPQLYEGHLFWDTGFLFLGAEQLAYVGENTRFSLPVESIHYLGYTRLRFEWFRLILIQKQWRTATGQIESGYLAVREGRSAIAVRQDNYQLFERLQQWKAGNGSVLVLPAYLEELPLPNIGTVTSSSLKALQSDVKLIWKVVFPTSAFASVVLGLSMLGGFIACLSTCLAYFAYLLPILLFTDTTTSAATSSQPHPGLVAANEILPASAKEDLESV